MTLASLLDACGIQTYPGELDGELACVCPACRKGAANLPVEGMNGGVGARPWRLCHWGIR